MTIMRNRNISILAALISGVLLVVSTRVAYAQNRTESDRPEQFRPNSNLVIEALKISEPVSIDGVLEEPFWRLAQKLSNFSEVSPGDNEEPPVRTEAYVTYDDDNLYIGFICYDDDPAAIRATVCDRDRIFADDMVGIIIDTFRDMQNGYEFFINPHGIQADLRRIMNDEDLSYDVIWESAAVITLDGWTAEMAIPFRSIRFADSEEQRWGLHVIRVRPRNSRDQYSWAPISRDDVCLFCQAGLLTNIRGVKRGKNLEILPYAVSSESGALSDPDDPLSEFKNGGLDGNVGADVKYGITPGITLDLTYNPDFSQIETDAEQIDVNTTFALFYPEKRPFFLEGSDIFDTRIKAVYTRTINDPVAALKLTGKAKRYSVGYILGVDDHVTFTVPF